VRPNILTISLLFSLVSIALALFPFTGPAQAQEDNLLICINDFEDLNSNGIHDPGEGSFSGVDVFLQRAGQDNVVIDSLQTSLDEDCFAVNEPGDYVVEIRNEDTRFTVTTSTLVPVTITDSSVTVPLGAVTAPNQCFTGNTAPPNQICVRMFNDYNSNGRRDGGEPIVPGIDVNLVDRNLSETEDIIIQTLVTQTSYTCFSDLPPGQYRVSFPLLTTPYDPSNPYFILAPGQSNDSLLEFQGSNDAACLEFGVQTGDPLSRESILPRGEEENAVEIDQDTRLMLSFAGAALVMLFMLGLGAILVALIRR
jgi:hypothetical protein